MYLLPFPHPSKISITDLQRFWDKIERTETCWLWKGSKRSGYEDQESYGGFYLQGSNYAAHRVAYFFEYRVDPGEELVLHECNTVLCVKPTHLYLGSNSDNMKFRSESGRHPRGELTGKTILFESQIPVILRRHASGETGYAIAKSLGTSQGAIERIINGDTWKHVPR